MRRFVSQGYKAELRNFSVNVSVMAYGFLALKMAWITEGDETVESVSLSVLRLTGCLKSTKND
jgi:hypothetical protein